MPRALFGFRGRFLRVEHRPAAETGCAFSTVYDVFPRRLSRSADPADTSAYDSYMTVSRNGKCKVRRCPARVARGFVVEALTA
jgi:hypothetical protein